MNEQIDHYNTEIERLSAEIDQKRAELKAVVKERDRLVARERAEEMLRNMSDSEREALREIFNIESV